MASRRKARLANGVFASGVVLAVLPAGPALAEPRDIDIPSEEAAKSIPEFARQENIQIIAPVSQLASSTKPAARHAPTVLDGSCVPLKYFHVAPFGSSVTSVLTGGVPEARQFPPRSLSNAGFASSIDNPGGSPTVGHGNPS